MEINQKTIYKKVRTNKLNIVYKINSNIWI